MRFDAIFTNRNGYSIDVHDEVKQWVASNIDRWKADKEIWFHIEAIDDMWLPSDVIAAEGGERRNRSSVLSQEPFRKLVGSCPEGGEGEEEEEESRNDRNELKKRWTILAKEVYGKRSNNHKSNFNLVKR